MASENLPARYNSTTLSLSAAASCCAIAGAPAKQAVSVAMIKPMRRACFMKQPPAHSIASTAPRPAFRLQRRGTLRRHPGYPWHCPQQDGEHRNRKAYVGLTVAPGRRRICAHPAPVRGPSARALSAVQSAGLRPIQRRHWPAAPMRCRRDGVTLCTHIVSSVASISGGLCHSITHSRAVFGRVEAICPALSWPDWCRRSLRHRPTDPWVSSIADDAGRCVNATAAKVADAPGCRRSVGIAGGIARTIFWATAQTMANPT
jgi:hypothetical protein